VSIAVGKTMPDLQERYFDRYQTGGDRGRMFLIVGLALVHHLQIKALNI
jgi:hypothetical protein